MTGTAAIWAGVDGNNGANDAIVGAKPGELTNSSENAIAITASAVAQSPVLHGCASTLLCKDTAKFPGGHLFGNIAAGEAGGAGKRSPRRTKDPF